MMIVVYSSHNRSSSIAIEFITPLTLEEHFLSKPMLLFVLCSTPSPQSTQPSNGRSIRPRHRRRHIRIRRRRTLTTRPGQFLPTLPPLLFISRSIHRLLLLLHGYPRALLPDLLVEDRAFLGVASVPGAGEPPEDEEEGDADDGGEGGDGDYGVFADHGWILGGGGFWMWGLWWRLLVLRNEGWAEMRAWELRMEVEGETC
jgi:hypothetical protein